MTNVHTHTEIQKKEKTNKHIKKGERQTKRQRQIERERKINREIEENAKIPCRDEAPGDIWQSPHSPPASDAFQHSVFHVPSAAAQLFVVRRPFP